MEREAELVFGFDIMKEVVNSKKMQEHVFC